MPSLACGPEGSAQTSSFPWQGCSQVSTGTGSKQSWEAFVLSLLSEKGWESQIPLCIAYFMHPTPLCSCQVGTQLCPNSYPCPGCPSQRDTSSCTASSLRSARISKLFFLLSLTPSFSKFNSEQPAVFSLTGLLWVIICVRIN